MSIPLLEVTPTTPESARYEGTKYQTGTILKFTVLKDITSDTESQLNLGWLSANLPSRHLILSYLNCTLNHLDAAPLQRGVSFAAGQVRCLSAAE